MMAKNQPIEDQLREMRSRMHSGTADGEQYDTVLRLGKLLTTIRNLGESADTELYRHFPVASISVLETHFKSVVALVINAGSPYLERGLGLAKDRLKSAIEVLPSVQKKTVTLGEFIAYMLPFNSVSSLETVLDLLLGKSLKTLVASTVGIHNQRNGNIEQDPLVGDVDQLWEDLAKAFQMRHILAHEAATKYEVSYAAALSCLKAVTDFTMVLDAILWTTVWKDEPLTQYEMNEHAWNEYKKIRVQLAIHLRKGVRIAAEEKERAKYNKLHLDWKRISKDWTAFENQQFYMGSILPLMRATSLIRAHEQRLSSVEAWNELRRPDDTQT